MAEDDIEPIIEEIHEVRCQIRGRFGGDIAAIMKDAQQRQNASARPVWKGPKASDKPQPNDGAT